MGRQVQDRLDRPPATLAVVQLDHGQPSPPCRPDVFLHEDQVPVGHAQREWVGPLATLGSLEETKRAAVVGPRVTVLIRYRHDPALGRGLAIDEPTDVADEDRRQPAGDTQRIKLRPTRRAARDRISRAKLRQRALGACGRCGPRQQPTHLRDVGTPTATQRECIDPACHLADHPRRAIQRGRQPCDRQGSAQQHLRTTRLKTERVGPIPGRQADPMLELPDTHGRCRPARDRARAAIEPDHDVDQFDIATVRAVPRR